MEFTFDNSIDPKTKKKRHIYKLGGRRLTGITTILGVISKPMLIPWASRMAVEYIKDNFKGELTDELLENAKNAHRIKKETAGEQGTSCHEMVEGLIKIAMEKDGFIIQPNHSDKQVQHFINWAQKYKVRFLATEKKMYDAENFIAGTCDFICEIDGEKLVGDLKTSGAIYPEHFFQAGAYRFMLETMGEKDFVGSVIVRLGKDGKFNEDEDVIISHNYEDEKKAFLSALNLYRIGNNYKRKNKFTKAL